MRLSDVAPDQTSLPPSDNPEMWNAVVMEHQENLDDVWGSVPASPTNAHDTARENSTVHPSDIPRLQAEHSTAGYREGITAGKALSIQAGFDEGYSLGAALGSKVGQILGVLEGIAAALATDKSSFAEEADQLLHDAQRELAQEQLFSSEYWEGDGTWKYEVGDGVEGNDGPVFADVAAAHPVIRKWAGILLAEVDKWNLVYDLYGADSNDVREVTPEKHVSGPGVSAAKPMEW